MAEAEAAPATAAATEWEGSFLPTLSAPAPHEVRPPRHSKTLSTADPINYRRAGVGNGRCRVARAAGRDILGL